MLVTLTDGMGLRRRPRLVVVNGHGRVARVGAVPGGERRVPVDGERHQCIHVGVALPGTGPGAVQPLEHCAKSLPRREVVVG